MSVRHLYLFALAATLGCATAPKNAPPQGNSNVITEEEIASSGVINAYEAVQRLRPKFLRARSPGSSLRNYNAGYPVVYISGMRHGDIQTLRQIPIIQITEIRYYNAAEANTKFGIDMPNGIIDLKLKGT